MKKLLLSIIVVGFVFGCNAQTMEGNYWKSKDTSKRIMFYEISATDQFYNEIRMSGDDSTITIKGDTQLILRAMFRFYAELNNKYWAAKEILRYVSKDHYITDKKKFDAAVKAYLKLEEK